jgi:hypothetical protein
MNLPGLDFRKAPRVINRLALSELPQPLPPPQHNYHPAPLDVFALCKQLVSLCETNNAVHPIAGCSSASSVWIGF